jgi:hypothetical protein
MDNELNDTSLNIELINNNQISSTTSPSTSNISNLANKLNDVLDDFNDNNNIISSSSSNGQIQMSSLYTRPIGSEREDLHVILYYFFKVFSLNYLFNFYRI